MRNILLAVVGLLLVALLIFLGWRYIFRGEGGVPVAVDDSLTTAYETAVSGSVAANVSDPDEDPLTFQTTLPQLPQNGAATLDAAGNFTYTPNAGFSGGDQFTYQVCDPGSNCATATVTITVEASAVVAHDDAAETMLNTAVPISVVANDQGDNLAAPTLSSGPASGTAVVETNLIVYTPNQGHVGSDSFAYAICNAANVCDSAQVVVSVRDFQLTDDQFNTPKNAVLANNVKSNDSGESTVTTQPTSAPANGVLTLQGSGEFSYSPNNDFVGEDRFSYEACNTSGMCATATVVIKVGGPVTAVDGAETTKNKPVSGDVSKNDQGDNLQVNQTPVNAPANGGLVLLGDGRFTYTPNADFVGSDTFTYETCDSDGLCAQAVVTVSVQAVPSTAVHTVAHGEWLLQIARCYGTTVQAIRAYNYIYHPDYIYPGQVLFIPNVGTAGPYYGPACVEYHMVAAGETLESVAAKFNITASELARINGLYRYYYYYVRDYYNYVYYPCSGYSYYPNFGYYQRIDYIMELYEGQMLILPKPVPDYMRAGS